MSNHQSTCGEKKIGESTLRKICFFFKKINFGFWAEKTWTFSKTEGKILETVAYRCRGTFSENFPDGKIFVWKFSVIERKHRISGENVFSELSKAHFKSPVQHFERKLIKINFTFCGLFRTVCVFFCYERKVSQECQIHKLSVQRKNLGRVFVTQMLFQNIFWFWAEKLGVLAENYPHGCQIYILWVRRNIFREAFLKQVCKRFNFLGVSVKIPWQQSTIIFIVDKIAKSVSMNKLRKNLFQEKKNYFNFFKFLGEVVFTISEKLPHWLSKLQSTYLCKVLKKNIYFSKIERVFKLLRNWDEKNRASSQKIFFRVCTTGIRASREKFWGKMISLSKEFYFSVIIFGVWVISLSFFSQSFKQNSLVRCVKPPINVRREKKFWKLTLKNCVLWTILDFEEKKFGLPVKQ